ncbi:MAG: MarR family transcriptional regulator [Polyangiaceae bacterium]|nr:MarR family transcriptional regulator [Polyangiaceae bacterium]
MAIERSEAGDALTDLALRIFRVSGRLLAAADEMTEGSGLTAARWQVLGAVLAGPLSVADVGRAMGLTRQSVQRLADVLVAEGICEYLDNPAHRRAKLLAPTAKGRAAIAEVHPIQAEWTSRVGDAVGAVALRDAVATLDAILAALDSPHGKVKPDAPARGPRKRA